MLAFVSSASLLGVEGHRVTVEVHASSGLPSYTIVGLPDASCRESRDRVRAALLSSEQQWPQCRLTVNLAPTGLPKAGAGLDLAIAIGILAATDKLPSERLVDHAFIGELGLDGSIRAVAGALPLVGALDCATVVVPMLCLDEARVVGRCQVIGARTLRDVIDALTDLAPWPAQPPPVATAEAHALPDLREVRGQPLARKALEVAAAGGHHLLMVGPPGAGKTMLARRLPGLLPRLDAGQSIEVSCIHSAAGLPLPDRGLVSSPPFRAPHHSASTVSLVGGGTLSLRPGEISIAHCGVLFLDELGEFSAVALDSLRQPLEDGVIRLSRAHGSAVLPSRFVLVAAMNPCPCGATGGPGLCRCGSAARARYHRRVSGPLLDRFDLRVDVKPVAAEALLARDAKIEMIDRPALENARRAQTERARAFKLVRPYNARIPPSLMNVAVRPSVEASDLLTKSALQFGLSGRGIHRTLRVARTIADLKADVRVEACDARGAPVPRGERIGEQPTPGVRDPAGFT